MSQLQGFLWSMGRCATKAVADTISAHTPAHATSWVDTTQMMKSPAYYIKHAPVPLVMTLHHPQYCDTFGKLTQQFADAPVVHTVRDPISNLKSFAKTFLTSFVARRVDEAGQLSAQGKSVADAINPAALEEWLLPTADLWRQYNAYKNSPHLIVDFADLGEDHFVGTMEEIIGFLGLTIETPITWTTEANTECDRFFVGYQRSFTLMDKKLDLQFSRWPNHWGEFGMTTLGELRSEALREVCGDDPIYIHIASDQLCTFGRLDYECATFAAYMAEDAVREAIAHQVATDYANTAEIVAKDLTGLQSRLIAKFEKTSRNGVKRFLKLKPELEARWAGWQELMERKAA